MSEESSEKTTAIVQVVDRVLALGMFVELDRLFTALFGIPADVLTEQRLKRLARIQEMRTKKAELLGVSEPKALPEKVAQEVLTGAAVEEDEDMQELWANLLANFDAGKPLNTFLTGLLKNLDGKTAKVLLFFWDKSRAIRPEMEQCTTWDQWIEVSRKAHVEDAELVANLGDWAVGERVRLQAIGLISFVVTGTRNTFFCLEEAGHMLCASLTAPKLSLVASQVT